MLIRDNFSNMRNWSKPLAGSIVAGGYQLSNPGVGWFGQQTYVANSMCLRGIDLRHFSSFEVSLEVDIQPAATDLYQLFLVLNRDIIINGSLKGLSIYDGQNFYETTLVAFDAWVNQGHHQGTFRMKMKANSSFVFAEIDYGVLVAKAKRDGWL